MRGWTGRLLRVDAGSGDVWTEEIPAEVLRSLLGGKGLGAYLLHRLAPPGADPLGPDNPIIFAVGPLTALFPGCGRYAVVTKSPMTGYFLDSHASGNLGAEIKLAGFDAVAITGSAPVPSYLLVESGEGELVEAPWLAGADVYDAHDRVASREPGASVAVVGPAAERLVRFCVVHSERLHAAGRGGAGTVMASKGLKALAARGSEAPAAADPEALLSLWSAVESRYSGRWGPANDGTTGAVEDAQELGMLPTRNFSTTSFEFADRYSADEVRRYRAADLSCFACPRACVKLHRLPDGTVTAVRYEGMAMLGSNLGLEDPRDMIRLYERCNRLGMDVISAGSAMALAAEAAEMGLIEGEFSDLRFGDAEGFLRLADAIARREGIGDLLAEGAARAAARLGVPELAVHVKGLDVPAWDPRGRLGLGLSYATADVGASHLRGWPSSPEKPDRSALDVVESMVRSRDQKAVADSLVICSFLDVGLGEYAEALEAAAGERYSEEDLLRVGWRVETLTRLFNLREGLDPGSEDVLPPKLWKPVPDGPSKGRRAFVSEEDFRACLRKFYLIRGWDERGRPTGETVRSLGIDRLLRDQIRR